MTTVRMYIPREGRSVPIQIGHDHRTGSFKDSATQTDSTDTEPGNEEVRENETENNEPE